MTRAIETEHASGAPIDAHVIVDRGSFRLDAKVRVEHGETVAVMGRSGAGKSTLLSAIAGLTRLSGGSIGFGNDASATRRRHLRPQKRGVVLLGQEPRLFPHLSARDNVAFGLRSRGLDAAHARTDADEWLWQVGLGGSGDHRPRELSGGQQQRVAIARALAAAPRAVLLDEPLTALDPDTAADIRALLLEQLAASRVAALLVTHDVTDAAALARHLLILEDGRVTDEGPTRDVLTHPRTPFAAVVAGLNRVVGSGSQGACVVKASEGPVRIGGADAGAVRDAQRATALFRPGDVHLELAAENSWTGALRIARGGEPHPGEWLARVVRFESTPSGARVVTEEPRVAVDIPADRLAELRLAPGDPVRLSVAAEHVRVLGPEEDARRSRE